MPLDDRWIPAHQEWQYVCDGAGCPEIIRVPGPERQHRPEGYFVDVARVTAAGKHSQTSATLFFHTKECLVSAMQYQLSSLMAETVVPTKEA